MLAVANLRNPETKPRRQFRRHVVGRAGTGESRGDGAYVFLSWRRFWIGGEGVCSFTRSPWRWKRHYLWGPNLAVYSEEGYFLIQKHDNALSVQGDILQRCCDPLLEL